MKKMVVCRKDAYQEIESVSPNEDRLVKKKNYQHYFQVVFFFF